MSSDCITAVAGRIDGFQRDRLRLNSGNRVKQDSTREQDNP